MGDRRGFVTSSTSSSRGCFTRLAGAESCSSDGNLQQSIHSTDGEACLCPTPDPHIPYPQILDSEPETCRRKHALL